MGCRRSNLERLFFMVLLVFSGSYAQVTRACMDVDQDLLTLIKGKQYDKAEKLTLEREAKTPDDKNAHLNLAYVYFHRAFVDTISIDTRAMGFGDGETGTFQLKGGDVEKYFSSATRHDPAYGEKTETEFKEIIRRWPGDKAAYFCLMNYYQQAGRHDDLINFIPRVVSAFSASGYGLVDELLPYAARYLTDNKPDLAAGFYKALLVRFPKSAPVLSSLGVATLKMDDIDGGLELFLKAYDQDKKDPIILRNLSEAHIYKQDFEKAEDYLNLLLKIKPEKTESYFRLATLKMRSGPEASKKYWSGYLEQNKTNPDDEYWSGLAKKILEGIEQGLTDDDLLNLAVNFNRSNAPFYAIPILAYLIKKEPDNLYCPFLFAQAYEIGGFTKLAYGYVKRAAEMANHSGSMDDESIANINFEAAGLLIWLGGSMTA